MVVIKCKEDITTTARLPPHISQFAEKILSGILRSIPTYNPEDDGYLVVVTPEDMDAGLCAEFGQCYADNTWEGVSYSAEYHCYHAVFTNSNQFTISVLVNSLDPKIDPAIIDRMVRETT